MPNPSTSRGYLSSARISPAPGAYAEVLATDFGVPGGSAPALAYNAGQGSLAMSTARCAISWVTAAGESLVSAENTVSIAAGTGAFTITQPTVPTNGGTVIAWRVYSSSGGAGSALLNVAANSTTQVQSNFTTTQGVLLAFPVATTSVQVLIYGAGQAEPTVDQSGIQLTLPTVAANSAVDYFIRVPNTAGNFDTQKLVQLMRPQGIADPAGILVIPQGFSQPLYPGTSQSVSLGVYMFLAYTLFLCTASGTTASTFIGGAAFNKTKASTTTDGTVTWTSLGEQGLIRLRLINASGSGAIPIAQEMDFFQS